MAYYHRDRAFTAYNYFSHLGVLSKVDNTLKIPEALNDVPEFIKDNFDRDRQTLTECIERLKELEDANPHADMVYHVDQISVYVPCKPGPGGHRARREWISGDFEQKVDFYSLCRFYMETYMGFITHAQKAAQSRLEGYRKWRKSEECERLINMIVENEWNKRYVRHHFSKYTYEMLLQKDIEWSVINGWSFFYTGTKHTEKYKEKTDGRLAALKEKLSTGGNLTSADRKWMSNHGIKVSELK